MADPSPARHCTYLDYPRRFSVQFCATPVISLSQVVVHPPLFLLRVSFSSHAPRLITPSPSPNLHVQHDSLVVSIDCVAITPCPGSNISTSDVLTQKYSSSRCLGSVQEPRVSLGVTTLLGHLGTPSQSSDTCDSLQSSQPPSLRHVDPSCR